MITYFPLKEYYRLGLKKRKKIKMERGAVFKIREPLNEIEKYSKTLKNIKNKPPALCNNEIVLYGSCTSIDAPIWLYKLPEYICFDLGYEVVGTLHALNYDGLSENEIAKLRSFCNKQIPKLIDLAEQAKSDIEYDWQDVINPYNPCKSSIEHLLEESAIFINEVLAKIAQSKNRSQNIHSHKYKPARKASVKI
jgi:hypothetical protein